MFGDFTDVRWPAGGELPTFRPGDHDTTSFLGFRGFRCGKGGGSGKKNGRLWMILRKRGDIQGKGCGKRWGKGGGDPPKNGEGKGGNHQREKLGKIKCVEAVE